MGYDTITGFQIHVFLIVNFHIHEEDINSQSLTSPYNTIDDFTSYEDIHEKISEENKILIFLGCGNHKIKRKAQQIACKNAIEGLQKFI